MVIEHIDLYDDNEYYCNVTCINRNSITSREFLLCAQDYKKNESSILRFRIDIILCKYSELHTDQCTFFSI